MDQLLELLGGSAVARRDTAEAPRPEEEPVVLVAPQAFCGAPTSNLHDIVLCHRVE